MARVVFTSQLQRHLPAPEQDVVADTVAAALQAVFDAHPALRGYILDDQGSVRKHVALYVDGVRITDRAGLAQAIGPGTEIHVLQALSGG